MEDKMFYSFKFPQMPKTRATNSLVSIFAIVVLTILMIFSKRQTWEKLLFFPTTLLFVLIIYRIDLINKYLIKGIERVFTENSELSKKESMYEALLKADTNFAVLRKNKLLIYSLALILILAVISYSVIHPKPIYTFYFYWAFMLIGLSMIIVFDLQAIFKYFHNVMEICNQKISDDKDFSGSFLKIRWADYERKWKILLILMGVTMGLFFMAHIFIIQYQRLFYLTSYLVSFIILGFITLDADKIAEMCSTDLGNYDEFVKSKLGMLSLVPQSFEIKTAYASFLNEMKELHKPNINAIKIFVDIFMGLFLFFAGILLLLNLDCFIKYDLLEAIFFQLIISGLGIAAIILGLRRIFVAAKSISKV